jgi:hypothetical protein
MNVAEFPEYKLNIFLTLVSTYVQLSNSCQKVVSVALCLVVKSTDPGLEHLDEIINQF